MNLFLKPFKKYSYLLGLILFAIIILKMNPGKFWQGIENIKISWIIFASLAIFPVILTKVWCWGYILRTQGIRYNFKDAFLMYHSGIYLGILTPGRIGEAAKVFYLKRDGYSFGKSLVSIILDRLTDLIFLLGFVFFGSLFFFAIYRKEIMVFFGGLVVISFLMALFMRRGVIKWILKKVFNFFVPKNKQGLWKINFYDFINDLKIYNLKNYVVIMLITTLSWFAYFFQMYLLAQGVGINVPIVYFSIAITITGLLTIIPLSIAGIGTRDAALIFLLSPFLILKERIIVFSSLILSMSLLTALMGFFCFLFLYRKGRRIDLKSGDY
jgi:glycosyltransferase 2 family protein